MDITEANSLDDMLNNYGEDEKSTERTQTKSEESSTETVDTTETPATEENTSTEDNSSTEPSRETKEDVTPEELFTGSKANQAFAQMRTQLKSYEAIVNKFAETLGVNTSDPEEMTAVLQNRLIEYEAKARQIPVDILKRLDETERKSQMQEAEALRNNANLSFQRLKDTYKLNSEDLQDFAKQLVEKGKDPYSQPMDLLQEYRSLNFDKLLRKAQDEAKAEAIKKQTQSTATSTSPTKTIGKSADPVKNVGSVKDLEDVLKGFGS